MSSGSRNAAAVLLSLFAGVADTATGCALVFAPALALQLMRVPPRDPAMVAFVGAFVGAVGIAYLWGLAAWRMTGTPRMLREVWKVTALIRLAAGLYSAVAIARGALEPGWWTVPAFDLGLAAVQTTLLKRGWLGGAP
jgi:H+/Cl- antiporter ClcA